MKMRIDDKVAYKIFKKHGKENNAVSMAWNWNWRVVDNIYMKGILIYKKKKYTLWTMIGIVGMLELLGGPQEGDLIWINVNKGGIVTLCYLNHEGELQTDVYPEMHFDKNKLEAAKI